MIIKLLLLWRHENKCEVISHSDSERSYIDRLQTEVECMIHVSRVLFITFLTDVLLVQPTLILITFQVAVLV